MKKLSKSRALWIVVALISLYGAAHDVYRTVYPYTYVSYRMIVNVETPEGLKTGSAVRKIILYCEPQIGEQVGCHAGLMSGEAVAVNLGKRGVLFSLMDGDGSYRVLFNTFPAPVPPLTANGIRYYKNLHKAVATLLPKDYPKMVTFSDMKAPKTIQAVDSNNLAKTFGSGVKLEDIKIEITHDPVVNRIDKYLPWLKEIYAKQSRLNGSTSTAIFNNDLASNLGAGSFKIGW